MKNRVNEASIGAMSDKQALAFEVAYRAENRLPAVSWAEANIGSDGLPINRPGGASAGRVGWFGCAGGFGWFGCAESK